MSFFSKNHISSLFFSLSTSWIYIKDIIKIPDICYEKNYLIFLTPVLTSLIYIFFLPSEKSDIYYINGDLIKKGDKKMGDKIKIKKLEMSAEF
jgi:hypothetical protein